MTPQEPNTHDTEVCRFDKRMKTRAVNLTPGQPRSDHNDLNTTNDYYYLSQMFGEDQDSEAPGDEHGPSESSAPEVEREIVGNILVHLSPPPFGDSFRVLPTEDAGPQPETIDTANHGQRTQPDDAEDSVPPKAENQGTEIAHRDDANSSHSWETDIFVHLEPTSPDWARSRTRAPILGEPRLQETPNANTTLLGMILDFLAALFRPLGF